MDPMTLAEYEKLATRTLRDDLTFMETLTMCGLGMAAEGGEFGDEMKKVLFHGHEFNPEKLIKEAGDALWYIAVAGHALGIGLDGIARANSAKLQARYPDGFSSERSRKRT